MTDLRTRIADIDEKHYQIIANDTGWACACGTQMNAGHAYREWRLHKADAVIEALDLREELWSTTDPVQLRRSWGKAPKYRRYVTNWEPSD